MSQDHDKLRAPTIVESIDERHISAEEATEKQLRKGVNAAETTARKGKSPCWKGRKELQSGMRPRENVEKASSIDGGKSSGETSGHPLLPPIQLRKWMK